MKHRTWFKENTPWWAVAIFAALLVFCTGLIVWGALFYEGQP